MVIDLTDGTAGWVLFESIRWPDGQPQCPHCLTKSRPEGRQHYRTKEQLTRTKKQSYRRFWKCWNCRKQFSALQGTVYENMRLGPSKLFYAMFLLSTRKKISTRELARLLEVNNVTATRLRAKITETVFGGLQ